MRCPQVAWCTPLSRSLRAGYPLGVPQTDYIPLLALLRRRLTDEQVTAVARHVATSDDLNIDIVDIGAAITRITDELPSRMISNASSTAWRR